MGYGRTNAFSLSGGGGDFYLCATVSGPHTVEYCTVANAGTSDCNGKYIETGATKNGQKIFSYTSGNATWYLFYITTQYEGNNWIISNSLNTSNIYDAHYYAGQISSSWSIGSGDDPAPSVTAGSEVVDGDQPKTWTGYKAVLADGVYTFEGTVTSGLTYADAYRPEPGRVYNNGADAIAYLSNGGILLKLPFESGSLMDFSGIGHKVLATGGSAGQVGGKNAWNFNGGFLQVQPFNDDFNFGTSEFRFEADIYPTSSSRQCFLGYEIDSVFSIAFSYNSDNLFSVFYPGSWTNNRISDALTMNTWTHVAFQRKNGVLSCYINGTKTSYDISIPNVSIGAHNQLLGFGRWGGDPSDFNSRWQGYMDNIQVSNKSV